VLAESVDVTLIQVLACATYISRVVLEYIAVQIRSAGAAQVSQYLTPCVLSFATL
jgi:hypothetical protein